MPPRPGPSLAGLMLGAALLVSFFIHAALLGTVLVASPRPNPTVHVESVTVDLVPETAAEEPEKSPPPVEKPQPVPEKKLPPRLEIPDFTHLLAAEQAARNATPPPARPPSTPADQQAASPSAAASSSPTTPPAQPDDAPPPVAETSPEDAVAAAARIADLMHLPELSALGAFDGAPADTKAKLSDAEIAAFRAELRKCWSAPSEVPAGQKPKAVIRVALKPDGAFSAQPQLLAVSVPMHGAPVVKSAMQALAQCQPYRSLPAGKYKEWKLLDLEFTAQDVAGVSSIADPKAPPKP